MWLWSLLSLKRYVKLSFAMGVVKQFHKLSCIFVRLNWCGKLPLIFVEVNGMTGDELYECAKAVVSRADFIRFVECLNQDHKNNGDEWQNLTLDQFLAGLSGFSRDMSGYYKNMGEVVDVEEITWKMAAEMLLAATVYGA